MGSFWRASCVEGALLAWSSCRGFGGFWFALGGVREELNSSGEGELARSYSIGLVDGLFLFFFLFFPCFGIFFSLPTGVELTGFAEIIERENKMMFLHG